MVILRDQQKCIFSLVQVVALLLSSHVTCFANHSTATATERPWHGLLFPLSKVATTQQLLAVHIICLYGLFFISTMAPKVQLKRLLTLRHPERGESRQAEGMHSLHSSFLQQNWKH